MIVQNRGVADLDDFIAAIAGDDPAYSDRWPRVEWQAAFNAYRAFTGGPHQFRLRPFPGIPEWLRLLVDGRAVPDTDTPAPTLCRLWTEQLNWFTVVDEHPDDLQLWIDNPVDGRHVTQQQLRAAHAAAITAGGVPVLTVHLDPLIHSEDIRTLVSIEALYVIAHTGTEAADAAAAALGWPGSVPYFFASPDDVLAGVGLSAGTVTAWEWL